MSYANYNSYLANRTICCCRSPNGTVGATGATGATVTVQAGTNISVNGTASNPIVSLKNPLTAQLNIGTNAIVSSIGDIAVNASASAGTGNIVITPKIGAYIIMTNLPTSAVGLPSGALWNNVGVLNIAP